jgi:hypothetical protein
MDEMLRQEKFDAELKVCVFFCYCVGGFDLLCGVCGCVIVLVGLFCV